MPAGMDFCCPPAWSPVSAYKEYPMSAVTQMALTASTERRTTAD